MSLPSYITRRWTKQHGSDSCGVELCAVQGNKRTSSNRTQDWCYIGELWILKATEERMQMIRQDQTVESDEQPNPQ